MHRRKIRSGPTLGNAHFFGTTLLCAETPVGGASTKDWTVPRTSSASLPLRKSASLDEDANRSDVGELSEGASGLPLVCCWDNAQRQLEWAALLSVQSANSVDLGTIQKVAVGFCGTLSDFWLHLGSSLELLGTVTNFLSRHLLVELSCGLVPLSSSFGSCWRGQGSWRPGFADGTAGPAAMLWTCWSAFLAVGLRRPVREILLAVCQRSDPDPVAAVPARRKASDEHHFCNRHVCREPGRKNHGCVC